jgi:sulfonate transport system permease protein
MSELAAANPVGMGRAQSRAALGSAAASRQSGLSAKVRTALPAIVPALLFLLWTIAASRHWMSPQVLPAPALVWQTARELLSDNLLSNLAISLRRLSLGFGLAVVAGAALGGVMGLSHRAEAIIYPTFMAIVQIPTLAWIPFLMMLLGLGEALKIVIIVKAVIAPVAIYTHVGVRDVNPGLLEAARILRLPPMLRILRVIAPASLPSFLTGLRLGLAQGWTALVAVELLASSEGIGFLMVWGRQLFQLDVVFVCIFVIGLVGLVTDGALQELDRALVRWPRPALAERRVGVAGSLLGWQFMLPALLLTLWIVADWRGWANPNLLPPVSTVLHVLGGGLGDGTFGPALELSLMRAFLGLAIGGGLGFAIGLAMGLMPTIDRLLNGTLTVLRLVAIFAWIPLLTAWVGLGEPSKITFVAIASFFPMQVATQRGVGNLSLHLIEAARALRLGPLARSRYLVLPGIAPSVFAGLRLALLQSWIGTMGAEYFMPSGGGIGSLMINAQQLFRTDTVLAAMILVGFAAAFFNWLGRLIEARATRWRAA